MSDRHVLVLKGSPRENGNSAILADQAAAGAIEVGAIVDTFLLHNMTIHPCDGCGACHITSDRECVIDDDMQLLYPKLIQADAIVVASPIYWFTINAQTKLCIDRWYALERPGGNELRGKQFGLILTYGDPDPMSSGAVNAVHMFQDMFRYVQAELAGMVYGTTGEAGEVKKQEPLLQAAYQLGRKLGTGF